MQEKFIKGGYNYFKELESKPINSLKPHEIRILTVCGVYDNEDEVDACVRGFVEGAGYSKEMSKEAIEKLVKELMR